MSRWRVITLLVLWSCAAAPPAVSAGDRGPCGQEPRDRLQSAFGWLISLRQVEVHDGQVVVTIGFRNSRAASGLIGIGPAVESHTLLVKPDSSGGTPVQSVEGIAVKVRKIERDQAGSARFIFPHPGVAGPVQFKSTWMTPIMQGAGQKIQVQFPIELPSREACS